MPRRRVSGDPSRAVAYLRVSTEEQLLGPEAQRMAITRWATQTNTTIVTWHSDTGISGASEVLERPALIQCLDDLITHQAGTFVVARRDRLARDVVVAASIERAVAQNGARVISADGVGNGDTPADQFMRTILDGAAAYERSLIRARTRAALKARRAQGKRAGEVPWGHGASPDGTLFPKESETRVTDRIQTLRSERLSLRAIVAVLGREGYCSRTGRPLGLTQVARILRGNAHSISK
jgi:site-specific DNA recombinase